MKKLFSIAAAAIALTAAVTSCKQDSSQQTWEKYQIWREDNKTWLAQQETLKDESGKPFYEKLSPVWAPGRYILIHRYGDPKANEGNLVPDLTSTVTARYIGRLYNDEKFDSGQITSSLTGLVEGWQIAMCAMHVGDSVKIVVPSQSGYGSASQGTIPPYSALTFEMKLVDIPGYEIRP